MNDFEYKYQKLSKLLKIIGFKNISCSNGFFSYEYDNFVFHIHIDYKNNYLDYIDYFYLNTYISTEDFSKNREKYKWVKILSLVNRDEQEYYELSYFEEERIIDDTNKDEIEKLIIKYLKKIFIKELRKNIINELGE